MATQEAAQLVIDGLPVSERRVAIKGEVAVPAEVVDAVLGGEDINVNVVTRLVARNQTFARDQWGDDTAGVKLVLEVVQTKRVKRADPELTEDSRALARAERDAERAEERRRFEAEQEQWRNDIASAEKDDAEGKAEGGELAARKAAALDGETPEPAGDESDPRTPDAA